jgi:hypothetical protein
MMTYTREEAHKRLEEYLRTLDIREKKEFVKLTIAWQDVSSELDRAITKLSKLENLSENQLYQLELYKRFLRDSKEVIQGYDLIASGIITNEQEMFAKLGLISSQELIGVEFSNKLNYEAVKFMVGNSKEGTPLYDLLKKSYPETVDRINTTLINSMALGRSPVETARLLQADMDGNLARALRVARTEQINVFREVQSMQYQQSGIVKAKDWVGTDDEKLCEICSAGIDNSPYPLDTVMDSHPNCRCSWSPVL